MYEKLSNLDFSFDKFDQENKKEERKRILL